jgi:hypothetical protein
MTDLTPDGAPESAIARIPAASVILMHRIVADDPSGGMPAA